MNEDLAKQLVIDEGMRLKPYRCTAGKLTIGIGRNLDDRGVTAEEAMFMLRNDIDLVLAELKLNLPWFEAAPEPVKQVLANMAFNMGMPRLLKFKKTLTFLEEGNYQKASIEMLDSRWASQVGSRATRLSNLLKSPA